ncbi:LexA family transcriptional regulator [Xenorhabdus sp. VLS]|uniref:LexA family transcriptional regulator n=2 Tax=Xenorhabdus lircayensis TaxID=2763499 RepID=A0ABS0U7Q6_9GAMM|nr:S24 family peptidase [Xenorhabdus lircayensis]MBI6549920.1 LexA family transcriptional regulator [Xenorhabdus lircayensis]
MSDFGILTKNIRYLMEIHEISSVTELSKRIKMHQPTLHRMLTGEVKDPKYTTLKNIAEFFKISPIDLIECDLRVSQPKTIVDVEGEPYSVNFKDVPVKRNAHLGDESYWAAGDITDGYIRWPTHDQDAYALKCTGNSMIPRIKEGEFVIIEPNHSYSPGDEVLLVTDADEVMIKTFLFEREGYCHLLPINENLAPIRIHNSKIFRMQYVAGIAKNSLWHS